MPSVEKYLKPEVINQIKRLDLRAQFVVRGFLQGLHASPFHGFSVEFSEHRSYTAGDDPKDIDWLVFAKTDKFYVKKFEAETNITGYLAMDLSQSMGYTYRQELTKFDYAICLAAVALLPDDLPAGSRGADHLRRTDTPLPGAAVQAHAVGQRAVAPHAAAARRARRTLPRSLTQIAAMLRHRSLVMVFSDLLADPEPVIARLAPTAASRPRRDRVPHPGRSRGAVSRSRAWSNSRNRRRSRGCRSMPITSAGIICRSWTQFRDTYRQECFQSGIDYVPLDTSMQFDKALLEYLLSRRARF